MSALLLIWAASSSAQGRRLPILDMHLHALAADAQGPPPVAMCAGIDAVPRWDQSVPYGRWFAELSTTDSCRDPIWSPMTDGEVMTRTLEVVERLNVIGVVSGSVERVAAWRAVAPDRLIPGLVFNVASDRAITPDSIRSLVESGSLTVLGEVTNQYAGIAPDDERMEPYWALAEELDIPVGIHVGTGPPGAIYLGFRGYRGRLHSALTMEEVLVRHPRLRVYLMHAGYPLLEDLLTLLYAHPQVYVDVGIISYAQPRAAFYRFLRGIVEMGFSTRIMFGSDQMVWPEAIERAIATIEEAPFLSAEQKRDIFYNNAAHFLRLSDAEIARHHGR